MSALKWVEWNGGKCPVPHNTLVEVMMLDGEIWDDELAGDYNWGDLDDWCGNIIAYRVLNINNVIERKQREFA